VPFAASLTKTQQRVPPHSAMPVPQRSNKNEVATKLRPSQDLGHSAQEPLSACDNVQFSATGTICRSKPATTAD
jgi:hypothetical protein